MDDLLRRLTPFVLVILAGAVWFEGYLPLGSLGELFGENGLPRFVIGILCLYIAMLVIERQRMEARFTGVLASFKDFYAKRAAAPPAQVDQAKSFEAIRILVAALHSPEAEVRDSAFDNLKRLTGKDFGLAPGAWENWLETDESMKQTEEL